MAKFNTKATFLNLVLVLSVLLLISTAESKQFVLGSKFKQAKPTAECGSVYGAQEGDTCSGVAQKFKLTLEFFGAINPNLNCDDIFSGQWLCIDGTA